MAEPEELTELPDDPNAIIGVRLGEIQELEKAHSAALASLEDARLDLAAIAQLLDCAPAEDVTPHQLVQSHILPRIRALQATQGLVTGYEDHLRQLDANGAPAFDVAPGVRAVRAGKRIQGLNPRALRGAVQQGKGPRLGER